MLILMFLGKKFDN